MTDWYPVPEYPAYQMTLDGLVRGKRGLLTPYLSSTGAPCVNLTHQGEPRRRQINTLVRLLTESLAKV